MLGSCRLLALPKFYVCQSVQEFDMSNNIRGLKRQSIIDNWLNGVEDPNFEVVPTRAEGKYIVKQRSNSDKTHAMGIPNSDTAEMQVAPKQDDNSQTAARPSGRAADTATPEANNSTNKGTSAENDKHNEEESIDEPPPSRDYISFDRELTNEILNQLKMINDDRRARDEKKQKKKELRRAIHKEFARSRVMVEDSSDEEPPQPIVIERPPPVRVRRRLNLLDRHR